VLEAIFIVDARGSNNCRRDERKVDDTAVTNSCLTKL
jgi:hypothetical protein